MNLSPLPIQKFFDNAGRPLNGGLLFTYVPATTTKLATYQDQAGTPNTNPIVLNFRGEANIWLDQTLTYKFVLAPEGDTDPPTRPIWSVDNISAGVTFSSLTQQIIGQILYPRTAAEIAASVTPVNYAYEPATIDLRRYGGDPTGVATSDTAMANAIAVCSVSGNGGVIRCPGPSANYKFASPIDISTKFNIIIEGECGPTQGAYGTRFTYTGTGTGVFINMDSASACQIRGIQVTHSSASFTGTYIRCNNDGSHGDPTQNAAIDCSFGNNTSSTIALDLNKCIEFTAERCTFTNGNPSIRGMAVGGYSNVIRIRDCQFLNCPAAPIQQGGQAWLIEGCTFEQLSTGAPGAILVPALTTQFQGLSIIGCWFGDATATAGTWIDIYGAGILIAGNYIAGNAAGSTGIKLRQSNGVAIIANEFSVLLAGVNFATATCGQISVKNNLFNTVTTAFVNDANVTLGTFDWGPNFGANTPSNHASLGTNGFSADPTTGIVEQWGLASFSASGQTASFPKTFPTACWNVVCTLVGVGSTANTIYPSAPSTTGFVATIGGAFTNPTTFFWRARGN